MVQFQSPLPIRGETLHNSTNTHCPRFQSPLPIRGETTVLFTKQTLTNISIPSPHTGRDHIVAGKLNILHHFNPLSPYGERHNLIKQVGTTYIYFNPLSPYGERLCGGIFITSHILFQSPLPIRGETAMLRAMSEADLISIPSPHTGRDGPETCVILTMQIISIPSPHTGRDSKHIQLFSKKSCHICTT